MLVYQRVLNALNIELTGAEEHKKKLSMILVTHEFMKFRATHIRTSRENADTLHRPIALGFAE